MFALGRTPDATVMYVVWCGGAGLMVMWCSGVILCFDVMACYDMIFWGV